MSGTSLIDLADPGDRPGSAPGSVILAVPVSGPTDPARAVARPAAGRAEPGSRHIRSAAPAELGPITPAPSRA